MESNREESLRPIACVGCSERKVKCDRKVFYAL
jgi:hypothetical protein